jgi:two-component system KDP operon response regulator KdpE
MAGARILAVDDEKEILRALRTYLTGHGYEVVTAETGREALSLFYGRRPDVILLDLGLPDIPGLDIIREVRSASTTPIIILSVRSDDRDKVEALEAGADDYLTKPFSVSELLARIRVALRHAAGPLAQNEPVVRINGLTIDLARRQVTRDGQEVRLTPTEFNLLKTLARYAGKVVTHRMLLREVWGPEYGDESHYLHVYMAQLRRKLEPDPQNPRFIITEPGIGYRLRTG